MCPGRAAALEADEGEANRTACVEGGDVERSAVSPACTHCRYVMAERKKNGRKKKKVSFVVSAQPGRSSAFPPRAHSVRTVSAAFWCCVKLVLGMVSGKPTRSAAGRNPANKSSFQESGFKKRSVAGFFFLVAFQCSWQRRQSKERADGGRKKEGSKRKIGKRSKSQRRIYVFPR